MSAGADRKGGKAAKKTCSATKSCSNRRKQTSQLYIHCPFLVVVVTVLQLMYSLVITFFLHSLMVMFLLHPLVVMFLLHPQVVMFFLRPMVVCSSCTLCTLWWFVLPAPSGDYVPPDPLVVMIPLYRLHLFISPLILLYCCHVHGLGSVSSSTLVFLQCFPVKCATHSFKNT